MTGRRIRDGKSADLEPIAPVGGWRAALEENVAAAQPGTIETADVVSRHPHRPRPNLPRGAVT